MIDSANIGARSLKSVIIFVVLVLLQVLICNNILLFGVGVPMIFIYFIFSLPISTSLNILITISFLLGFMIDLFSDTLGLNSLACIILAVARKPIFYAYMPREDKSNDMIPSILAMGWENYIKFALTLTALYCTVVFTIEFTSFAAFWRIVLMAVTSTILTTLLIIGIDSLSNSVKRNW